jgi:hypothetical protein
MFRRGTRKSCAECSAKNSLYPIRSALRDAHMLLNGISRQGSHYAGNARVVAGQLEAAIWLADAAIGDKQC